MTVKTREEAVKEASKLMPNDYELDNIASSRAGYDIYRHRELNPNCWISDLQTRLEVNINGTTTNIWIEDESQKPKRPMCERAQRLWCRREGYSCQDCD